MVTRDSAGYGGRDTLRQARNCWAPGVAPLHVLEPGGRALDICIVEYTQDQAPMAFLLTLLSS